MGLYASVLIYCHRRDYSLAHASTTQARWLPRQAPNDKGAIVFISSGWDRPTICMECSSQACTILLKTLLLHQGEHSGHRASLNGWARVLPENCRGPASAPLHLLSLNTVSSNSIVSRLPCRLIRGKDVTAGQVAPLGFVNQGLQLTFSIRIFTLFCKRLCEGVTSITIFKHLA